MAILGQRSAVAPDLDRDQPRRLAEAIAARIGPARRRWPGVIGSNGRRWRTVRSARYAPALMRDITADVPAAAAPPAATVRPTCVANDDWLTAPLRKPGGDGAPPARPEAAS